MPVASLSPRRCPRGRWPEFDPIDPFEVCVLVRLSSKYDELEKLEETVDAFESCLLDGEVGAEL